MTIYLGDLLISNGRSAQVALAAAAPPESGLHIVCTSLQTMAQAHLIGDLLITNDYTSANSYH